MHSLVRAASRNDLMGVKSELAKLTTQLAKAKTALANQKLDAAEDSVTNGIDIVKNLITVWAAKKKKIQDPTQKVKANFQMLINAVNEGKSDKYLASALF